MAIVQVLKQVNRMPVGPLPVSTWVPLDALAGLSIH